MNQLLDTTEQRLCWLEQELTTAYRAARVGKTKKPQVVEFDKIWKTEIPALALEIHQRRYTPRPSIAFIANRPVKREIFAADFRDRVVHHFLWGVMIVVDSETPGHV